MNYVESFKLFGTEAMQIPCIKGDGAPTTSTQGAVGCLYMDTSSKSKGLYKCVDVTEGVYTWEPCASGGTIEPFYVDIDLNFASHTAGDIFETVLSGRPVFARISDGFVIHLMSVTESRAIFYHIDYYGDFHQYVVEENGDVTRADDEYVTVSRINGLEDDMGNVSAALDGIIAIQNQLIGGDSV